MTCAKESHGEFVLELLEYRDRINSLYAIYAAAVYLLVSSFLGAKLIMFCTILWAISG